MALSISWYLPFEAELMGFRSLQVVGYTNLMVLGTKGANVYTAAKIAQVNVQKEDQFPEQAKKQAPGQGHADCGDISKPAMRVRSYSVYSIFSLHQPGKSPAKLPEN